MLMNLAVYLPVKDLIVFSAKYILDLPCKLNSNKGIYLAYMYNIHIYNNCMF